MCRLLIAGLVMLLPWPAAAQLPSSSTQTQALASCLADSTTGRDRKDLVRWMFFAIGSHPENKAFLVATAPAAIEDANGQVAMQELMAHPDVGVALSALEKHLDGQKLATVLAR